MKIRMKVEGSGPDGMVQPGEEIEVGDRTGQELVEAGLADSIEEESAEEAGLEEAPVEHVEEAEPAEDVPENAELEEEPAPAEDDADETSDLGGFETE